MILFHRIKVTGKFTYLGEEFIQAPRCLKDLILPLVRPLALKQPSPHTELQGVLARLTMDGESPEAGLCLFLDLSVESADCPFLERKSSSCQGARNATHWWNYE
jgi:hypothetical protein